MGLWYSPKTAKAQNRNKSCRNGLWRSFRGACIVSAGFSLFSAGTASGQTTLLEKTISIPKQNTTLYEALNQVSQKADCFFIYNSETVESDRKVRLHAVDQPLNKVLDDILSNSGLAYKILGRHILIYKAGTDAHPVTEAQRDIPATDTIRYAVVRGHVYDNENKSPVPFAAVGIAEENIGTVTNYDGFFALKIPVSLVGTSLVVSHLGYMSQRIPVPLLDGQEVDLCLDRRVISIQEVIIRYIDPKSIIEQAMDQRKVNYAADPVYLTTFYREGVQKNDTYISYSEAVFKVYKTPYDAGEYSDQVKLLKSRKIENEDPRDTVFVKLKAGVESALRLDIVRCIPGFLDLTQPVGYTYIYSGLVSYNARDAYAVTFVQIPGLDEALYTGTVYIDKEDFAILGADFEINPEYIDRAAEDLVLKKSLGLIVKLEKVNYSVSFMPFNGTYYLNHVRCDIRLKTRLRNHLSSDHFYTFLELASCHIDTAGVARFPKQEMLKPGVVFSDQPYRPNDAFWGGFNVITPEEGLSGALSKIIGKIEEIE